LRELLGAEGNSRKGVPKAQIKMDNSEITLPVLLECRRDVIKIGYVCRAKNDARA
jgi:hypothetical protein